VVLIVVFQQRVTMDTARSDLWTPRARAAARATQQRKQEKAAHRKERRIRWRECRDQESEEFRLREQQGLSPPVTPKNSSSEEEKEESDEGCPPRGGIPHPRHQGPQRW
jgi:hypothetical protein